MTANNTPRAPQAATIPLVYLNYRRGEKYGRLNVTDLDNRGGQTRWYACLCECGETRSAIEWKLLRGVVTECVRCEVRRKMEGAEP
jgi:hypothetical protein